MAFQRARLEGGLITRYAGDSPQEYLAEGFAAWGRGESNRPRFEAQDFGALAAQRANLDRGELRQKDPQLCELLEEAVARMEATAGD